MFPIPLLLIRTEALARASEWLTITHSIIDMNSFAFERCISKLLSDLESPRSCAVIPSCFDCEMAPSQFVIL